MRAHSLSSQPHQYISFKLSIRPIHTQSSSSSRRRRREMSYQRSHSSGNVPFSWENRPGVSKVIPSTEESPKARPPPKLPPPPFSTNSRKLSAHGLFVPLPPCPFQPSTRRSSSNKGMSRREEDPFLAAYMECTKSVKKQDKASSKGKGKGKGKGKLGFEKLGLAFSCKHTCGIREDSMVRLSQLPEIHPEGN